jgi:hypothetical protein
LINKEIVNKINESGLFCIKNDIVNIKEILSDSQSYLLVSSLIKNIYEKISDITNSLFEMCNNKQYDYFLLYMCMYLSSISSSIYSLKMNRKIQFLINKSHECINKLQSFDVLLNGSKS